MLTDTQIKRKASAKVKNYIAKCNDNTLIYSFRRGLFIIDNLNYETAKTMCENATGLPFIHVTQSMCKIDFQKLIS
jgi:hypothetical protein